MLRKETSRAKACGRRSRRRGERGAALVEFALIATPLFLILFGTIEFGWAMFQYNDIRHGAREGIRLGVVNADVNEMNVLDDGITTWREAVLDEYGASAETASPEVYATALLAQGACARMDDVADVSITLRYADSEADGALSVGDDLRLTASKTQLHQLTMVFDAVLGSVTIEEKIESRLEQNPPTGVAKDTNYPDPDGWACRE